MLKKEKEEIFEVQFYIVKKFSKFDFTSSRNSNLSHHWVIAGNFQNSILYRQEIFEIPFYFVIVLEKRMKFSKFDFMSSRNFRNSNLSYHWAGNFRNSILYCQEIFEIQFYLVIARKKEEIFEIRIYLVIEL